MPTNVIWIEIFEGKRKKWYFHGKARNGKIVYQSEGYTRKASAVRGARRILGSDIGIRVIKDPSLAK